MEGSTGFVEQHLSRRNGWWQQLIAWSTYISYSNNIVFTDILSFDSANPTVAQVGDLRIYSDVDDLLGQKFEIEQTLRHPEYTSNSIYNDIGLVKLKSSVRWVSFDILKFEFLASQISVASGKRSWYVIVQDMNRQKLNNCMAPVISILRLLLFLLLPGFHLNLRVLKRNTWWCYNLAEQINNISYIPRLSLDIVPACLWKNDLLPTDTFEVVGWGSRVSNLFFIDLPVWEVESKILMKWWPKPYFVHWRNFFRWWSLPNCHRDLWWDLSSEQD